MRRKNYRLDHNAPVECKVLCTSRCEEEDGRLPDLKISRNPVLAGIAKICLTGMVVALAYYAIFRLPFRFPPTQRLCSTSYAFGFNNTVAVVGISRSVRPSRRYC